VTTLPSALSATDAAGVGEAVATSGGVTIPPRDESDVPPTVGGSVVCGDGGRYTGGAVLQGVGASVASVGGATTALVGGSVSSPPEIEEDENDVGSGVE